MQHVFYYFQWKGSALVRPMANETSAREEVLCNRKRGMGERIRDVKLWFCATIKRRCIFYKNGSLSFHDQVSAGNDTDPMVTQFLLVYMTCLSTEYGSCFVLELIVIDLVKLCLGYFKMHSETYN